MKRVALTATLMLACTPVFAQQGTGNGAISGGHYNLNIVGVEKGKNPPMTKSERHTIFVGLGGKPNSGDPSVLTRIYLTPGTDFKVCDGNGFDTATDCGGNDVGREGVGGAVFMLPCNTNLDDMADTDHDGEPDTPVEIIPCDPSLGENVAYYGVWARALGAPGGESTTTTCAYDKTTGEDVCSLENVLLVRSATKPTFKEVTNELTSLVFCDDVTDKCFRVALFSGNLEDWFWQYDNRGLRLAQLRFYLLEPPVN